MASMLSHRTGTREAGKLPPWLRGFNRVMVALQRLGLVVGSMHVLTVPGRRSGVLRSTPVSLLTVDDHRYIVAGLDDADWVLNVRAASRGILRRGRTEEHVSLIELTVEDRGPILREFPRLIPRGVQFFTRLYGVGAEPEAFATLAAACPVFRVERR
jgi:deazaflavin-dependent oxidoreductase (nitroreductase family)